MFKLLLIFIVNSVYSLEIYQTSFSVSDQCINLCKSTDLIPLDLENYEQVVCQRGCRFFNIIRFKNEMNLNTTKKECFLSCKESYIVEKEYNVCKTGCEIMARKQQTEIASFLILSQDDVNNNIVLAEPDMELIETDFLSDPSIKSQLEIGFNIDYKIPETHIRTMPIELQDKYLTRTQNVDWLDCASRNSGIPRWLLLSAILLAVLFALWLSCLTEKQRHQECKGCTEEVRDTDKVNLLVEHNVDYCEKEVEFLNSTTKYTLETEKV